MNDRCVVDIVEQRANELEGKHIFVGLDGFVDKIAAAVDRRTGPGDCFSKMETIGHFARRISEAASKNANVEWFPVCEKMGGNGPLLANALLLTGAWVRYVGLLGKPIHPLFRDFARQTKAISLGQPGETHAVEFEDGKILFGYTCPLDVLTYEHLVGVVGEQSLTEIFAGSDLVALQNWTMIYGMNGILNGIVRYILPQIPVSSSPEWFFDLSDPQKRSVEDLNFALDCFKHFASRGHTSLSFNRGEAEQIGRTLNIPFDGFEPEVLAKWLSRIRTRLSIDAVALHCAQMSACDTANGFASAHCFDLDCKVCLTGSGDHFNAGFLVGRLLALDDAVCLRLGNAFAGAYISSGNAPTLADVRQFVRRSAAAAKATNDLKKIPV
jgi:hypothetical protein